MIRVHQIVVVTTLVLAACGMGGVDPAVQHWCSDEPDRRLLVGMNAGVDEYLRRGGTLDEPRPTQARLPDGSLHPLVERFAMDGDGRLRGEGPSMQSLLDMCRQVSQ